ncbi:MAG: tetratricopeptide repeat protein [Terracidiphilus sp.]
MPMLLNDRPNSENPSPGTRLDGWKDIATYLGKAERTVKRWEADRGLPIHRVPGGGRASVYAYRVELDEWLKSSNVSESDGSEAGTPQVFPGIAEIAPAHLTPAAPSAATSNQSSASDSLRPIPSASRQRWVLVLSGLLAVALLIGALWTSGGPLWGRVHSMFAKSGPKSTSAASTAVSDPEKALARDFYLKGRYEWNQRTPDSLTRALDLFTQAVVHDPGYAQAYVGMADTYDLLREYTTMPDSEAYSRAIVAAKKAVELDDSLAEGHRALAYSEMYGSWDFADAEKEFRRAIELNPKDAEARRWYANAFAVPGRFPECLAQMDKAQELDPGSHATLADKGIMLYNAGRTEEAIATLREVERSMPQFRSPHAYLMGINLDRRDYPAFLAEGQMTADAMNDPALKDIMASARAGYAQGGGGGLLRDLYAKQRQYYAAGKIVGTTLARTCVLMGKKQEALALLEEAYARHEADVLGCLSQPVLLTLKNEPRYKLLVKKINFPVPAGATTANSLAGIGAPASRSASPQ